MKNTILLSLVLVSPFSVLAQSNPPAVEDFKPSALNQPGRQYPQVNSERRVRARLAASGATNVLLDIGARKYPMTRG
ncbi:MAG TPA: esterase, partial [Verrucomicrobiae bacterium]|nr:esterase [Verrucomicrobiae bacterium]